jgi:PAS domain S-box-containing protein
MLFDETEVRRAFAEGEFVPFFQPLIELRTGQLAGFEVLARWNHGQLGEVAPDDFIPIVERVGLIDNLTRTILEQAFAAPALADSSLSLSINTSPSQLMDFKLPERFAAAAEEGGFSLDRLTIEVTESAIVDDLFRAAAVAGELKVLGCKLALDDYGTGYSSLKHLLALPFDELKVDRSFVSLMTRNREGRKIVASVVGLGQSLGLTTTAEGVETRQQADMLFQMGCEQGQGWLYSKPVPGSELAGMIAAAPQACSVCLPSLTTDSSILNSDALPGQRLAQLQAVYDGAPVGLCLLDRKLRYVSVNRRLAQMNGVPLAAHLGRTPAEVIPHTFPQVEAFIRRALRGEPVLGVEIRKPGTEEGKRGQTLMISYQPVRDEAGEVWGVSVAVMDITERKLMEDALRETENHHRNMVNLIPHVPWVLNAKGEITEASPRWQALTGQTLEEALGAGWLKALHPDDVAMTMESIRNSLLHGKQIDVKYRVRKVDGDWIWIWSRGSPHFGPSGEVVCIYGVAEELQRNEPHQALKRDSARA